MICGHFLVSMYIQYVLYNALAVKIETMQAIVLWYREKIWVRWTKTLKRVPICPPISNQSSNLKFSYSKKWLPKKRSSHEEVNGQLYRKTQEMSPGEFAKGGSKIVNKNLRFFCLINCENLNSKYSTVLV